MTLQSVPWPRARVLAVFAWLLVILAVTLGPTSADPSQVRSLGQWCLVCGQRGVADVILNVALFVPFGWAVAGIRGRAWALAAGLGLTLGVEGVQLALPTRFATLGDVVANGAGAALGAWIVGREARTLPCLAAGAILGVIAPVVLLAPDPPRGVYYGQWTPRFGNMAHYEGRVLDAELGGVTVASRRSERSDTLRAVLARDGPVRVRFEVGPEPERLAPIFSVFDARQRRIFLLGADGTDVVVQRWTRATTWRLDSPELRWPGVLAGLAPGDTARVEFARGDDTPCLTVNRRMWCDTEIGAGAGWTVLLFPDGLSRGGQTGISWLWMFLLGVMLGIQRWPVRTLLTLTLAAGTAILFLPLMAPHLAWSPSPAALFLVGAGVARWLRRAAPARSVRP